MSYEYKDEIIMNLKDYNAGRKVTGGTNAFESKLSELDQVYAHAPKADDYKAKAKAFDHIENLVKTELTSDDLYNDARNNDYAAGMLRVYKRVDYIIEEYESGELE